MDKGTTDSDTGEALLEHGQPVTVSSHGGRGELAFYKGTNPIGEGSTPIT